MRITSTYVENTVVCCGYSIKGKDHLHIRGEYMMTLIALLMMVGSPPHTWRILWNKHCSKWYLRITSTYVENTLRPSVDAVGDKDHLHIRGEYKTKTAETQASLGSPPHTWRILCHHRSSPYGLRITSTYVENTGIIQLRLAKTWDHLHIRGEYLGMASLNSLASGSPPHTWRILAS